MNEMVRAALRGVVSTQRRVTCQAVIQMTDTECKCSHTSAQIMRHLRRAPGPPWPGGSPQTFPSTGGRRPKSISPVGTSLAKAKQPNSQKVEARLSSPKRRKKGLSGMDYTSQEAQRHNSGGATYSGICSPRTCGSERLLGQRKRILLLGWVPQLAEGSQSWSPGWWRDGGLRKKRSTDIYRVPCMPGAVRHK